MVHVNIGVINTDTEPTGHKKAAAIHMYNTQPKSRSPSPRWSSHIGLCSTLWAADVGEIQTLVWQSLQLRASHISTHVCDGSATRLDFGGGREEMTMKVRRGSREKKTHRRHVRGADVTCCEQNNEFFVPSEVRNSQRGPSAVTGLKDIRSMFADIKDTQPKHFSNVHGLVSRQVSNKPLFLLPSPLNDGSRNNSSQFVSLHL